MSWRLVPALPRPRRLFLVVGVLVAAALDGVRTTQTSFAILRCSVSFKYSHAARCRGDIFTMSIFRCQRRRRTLGCCACCVVAAAVYAPRRYFALRVVVAGNASFGAGFSRFTGRSSGGCCSERSAGQGLVGWGQGGVRICGVWRVIVAKSTLNSGKSTIGSGFRERFEPLATAGGRAASIGFTFSQFTGLYWFSARSGIG